MPADQELDLYVEGASIAFDVPLDQVTRTQRAIVKEHCFWIVYSRLTTRENVRALVGAVAEGLRRQLKGAGA